MSSPDQGEGDETLLEDDMAQLDLEEVEKELALGAAEMSSQEATVPEKEKGTAEDDTVTPGERELEMQDIEGKWNFSLSCMNCECAKCNSTLCAFAHFAIDFTLILQMMKQTLPIL